MVSSMKPNDLVVVDCPSSPWHEWAGILLVVASEAHEAWVEISGQCLWFRDGELKLAVKDSICEALPQPETRNSIEISTPF